MRIVPNEKKKDKKRKQVWLTNTWCVLTFSRPTTATPCFPVLNHFTNALETDGPTDIRMSGRTDRLTHPPNFHHSSCISSINSKMEKTRYLHDFTNAWETNRRADLRTDLRTNKATYRHGRKHLKSSRATTKRSTKYAESIQLRKWQWKTTMRWTLVSTIKFCS